MHAGCQTRTRIARAVLGLNMVAIAAWGQAASAELTIGRTVQLADAGVRFSPIAEISMLPLPTPDTLVVSMGPDSFDVSDALELWQTRQMSALFTNALGRVIVARLGELPPTEDYLIQGRFIRRTDYGAAAVAPDRWDNQTMEAWITAFCGSPPEGFQTLGREQALRYPVRLYHWSGEEAGRHGFLVRLPQPTRFVWFQFELAEPNLQVARQAMMQSLRSVVAGTTRAGGKQANLGFQHLAGAGGSGDEYEATRRRVIQNIQALDEWWYVELPHYVLVSNLDKSNQRMVKELQEKLERVRDRFVALWPPVAEIREVSVVRLFQTREEYLDYVGGPNGWTMGVWMPAKRELVVSPEYAGAGREQILNTAYHEAFHQYIHYALDGLRIPTWLNEGHASLFEACRFTNNGRELHLEENEGRLEFLDVLPHFGLEVDLFELMYMTPQDFYVTQTTGERAEQLRGAHYATAWSLVYFLRRGAPVACATRGYHEIPDRIVQYLREHPNAFSEAMDHALAGVDRQQFRTDYANFWESKRLRGLAERRP